MGDTDTHEFRIKCMNCGLHYAVFSFDQKWAGDPDQGRQGGFCPECGIPGGKMVWGPVTTEEPIFTKVPGGPDNLPLMMTAARRTSRFGIGEPSEAEAQRGPYGTNEGDKWLAPDSDVQNRLDAEGNGHILIHEVLKGEDAVYVTSDPELIEEATEGHRLYVSAQAVRN